MTGKIKLVHSGGNSVSLAVPTSAPSASEVEFKLPQSDGSANQALVSDGSGNLSFASVAGGKILQIVQGSNNTQAQSTSGTYADTGLTANITTSSSHAGVFVITNLALGAEADNGQNSYGKFNLLRDSTQLREAFFGAFEGNVSGHRHTKFLLPTMNFYDTGTSASTTYTYKCQYAKQSNATYAFYNKNNSVGNTSYIFLIEVAA